MNIPDFGENEILWATIIGFMLPALISFINQAKWSSQVKGVVALASSVVAGAGTAYFAGQWNSEDVVRSIMIVLILSQVAYATFWKPTNIASSIERDTTIGKPPAGKK